MRLLRMCRSRHLVFLEILALGNKECKAGKLKPIDEVVARIKSLARKPAA